MTNVNVATVLNVVKSYLKTQWTMMWWALLPSNSVYWSSRTSKAAKCCGGPSQAQTSFSLLNSLVSYWKRVWHKRSVPFQSACSAVRDPTVLLGLYPCQLSEERALLGLSVSRWKCPCYLKEWSFWDGGVIAALWPGPEIKPHMEGERPSLTESIHRLFWGTKSNKLDGF